jgi:hypothetical protein
MDNTKPFYLSKTMIAAALVAVVPLIPGIGPVASAWITANPTAYGAILGAVFAGLRALTGGAVSIT